MSAVSHATWCHSKSCVGNCGNADAFTGDWKTRALDAEEFWASWEKKAKELQLELDVLKDPSDGRCMEIAALREYAKKLDKVIGAAKALYWTGPTKKELLETDTATWRALKDLGAALEELEKK